MNDTNWFHDLTTEESKQERATLAQRVIAVLGVLCFIVLVGIATNAYAQEIPLHVLEKQGVSIRLMNSPCVDQVSISRILPHVLHRFKAIASDWPERDGSRKAYAGCWAELTAEEAGGEAAFLVVFSDGESAAIPKSEFKKMKGQSGA